MGAILSCPLSYLLEDSLFFLFLFLLLDFFYSFTEEGNSMGSHVMQRTTYNEWGLLEGERKGREGGNRETDRDKRDRETERQPARKTDRQTDRHISLDAC